MTLHDQYLDRLAEWSDIQDHLAFMHDTVAGYDKPQVIELGVRSGNSTAALLAACEKSGGWLHSADLASPVVPPEWYAGPWSFMRGDSVSDGVLSWMPAECDVLFIDTSHTFEQTIAELDAYMPKVKPGGIALFHDTQWLPPALSLPEPGGPVKDALDAWCRAREMKWTPRLSEPGFYGMGVIRP